MFNGNQRSWGPPQHPAYRTRPWRRGNNRSRGGRGNRSQTPITPPPGIPGPRSRGPSFWPRPPHDLPQHPVPGPGGLNIYNPGTWTGQPQRDAQLPLDPPITPPITPHPPVPSAPAGARLSAETASSFTPPAEDNARGTSPLGVVQLPGFIVSPRLSIGAPPGLVQTTPLAHDSSVPYLPRISREAINLREDSEPDFADSMSAMPTATDARCLTCGQFADVNHRASWELCKAKCWLCNQNVDFHEGKVCNALFDGAFLKQ